MLFLGGRSWPEKGVGVVRRKAGRDSSPPRGLRPSLTPIPPSGALFALVDLTSHCLERFCP